MRGKKNGEVCIWKSKDSHLLDIDVDACHVTNNCAKKFASYF